MIVNGSEQYIIQILTQGLYQEIELNRPATFSYYFSVVSAELACGVSVKS